MGSDLAALTSQETFHINGKYKGKFPAQAVTSSGMANQTQSPEPGRDHKGSRSKNVWM